MSEGKHITLEVSGLLVQAGGLETYITSLVDDKMGDMDESEMESIAERVFDNKMPSGYDDPSDHYDMSDYTSRGDFEDLESTVSDIEREVIKPLEARVKALEEVIAQLRQVFAPADKEVAQHWVIAQ